MDTLAAFVAPALVLAIPIALAAAIVKLGGSGNGVTLAEFMAPLAAVDRVGRPSRIAVPESEPVAWRFDQPVDETVTPLTRHFVDLAPVGSAQRVAVS